MTQHYYSRPAAASGAVFAVALFVAAGDGGYSPIRAVLATVALTLAIPFLCYLAHILRSNGATSTWLTDIALASGLAGIVLKLASGVPDIAIHQGHLQPGTSLYEALTGLAEVTTSISLFPLALFCAATAVVALRSRVLPAWLGLGAAATAAALAVNGSVIGTAFVPALPAFLLWTLLTSLHLVRASRDPAVLSSHAPAAN